MKIHVFTTKEKPWQVAYPLHSWDAAKHVKLFVPVTTTVKELMQNLGCTNADAKKNVLHEVTEQGNGKWVKGLTIVVCFLLFFFIFFFGRFFLGLCVFRLGCILGIGNVGNVGD